MWLISKIGLFSIQPEERKKGYMIFSELCSQEYCDVTKRESLYPPTAYYADWTRESNNSDSVANSNIVHSSHFSTTATVTTNRWPSWQKACTIYSPPHLTGSRCRQWSHRRWRWWGWWTPAAWSHTHSRSCRPRTTWRWSTWKRSTSKLKQYLYRSYRPIDWLINWLL